MNSKKVKQRVLFLDIETAPLTANAWGLFDQNIALNQIQTDWHVLSWAAKWQGSKKVMYMDQRKAVDVTDDKKILAGIWKLLDEADVVVGQNSKRFDVKKLNARFVQNGFKPPSSYRQIDTLQLAKKHFAFTSNKLEYLTDKLNTKYKKLKHSKFPGFELWKQCLLGNKAAWKEMEKYNKWDVLSLEELFDKLITWDEAVVIEQDGSCNCGADSWIKKGFRFTNARKYIRLKCGECGAERKGEVA